MLKELAIASLAIGNLATPIGVNAQTPDQKHQCIRTIKSHYKIAWGKLEPKRKTAARLSLLSIGSDRPGARQMAKQLLAEVKKEESKIVGRFRAGSINCNRLTFVPPTPYAPRTSGGSSR